MPVRGMSRAEGQVRQDGQLLRGVGAVDIHRGIGFGIAELLCVGDRFGIVHAALFHLRQHVVAGAVEDRVQRQNLIGRQALADVGDDRDAAGDRGLEGD